MFKYYDMSFFYHPAKANVVENALSHMTIGSVSHIDEAKKDLVKDLHRLYWLGVRLEDSLDGCFIVSNKEESSLAVEAKSKQHIHK